MNIATNLAENIRSLRRMADMPQVKLAERLNVETSATSYQQATVWAIEEHRRRVTAVELHALSKIFDVSMDDLVSDSEPAIPLAWKLQAAVEAAIESVMGGSA